MARTFNRRTFMGQAAMVSNAALVSGSAFARGSRPFFASHGLNIGLQIYTLGDAAGKDVDETFARVAQIGYRAIELPNLLGRTPADLRAAADRAGLVIPSLHVPLTRKAYGSMLSLASDPAQLADTLGTLGAKTAVAPLLLLPDGFHPLPGEELATAIGRSVRAAGTDIWKFTANLLNERAAALKPYGVKVAYHNHNLEFAPIGDTNGWEILRRETDPTLVSFEVDIGWVAAAGLDPVTFLETIRGRVSHLHVKDMGAGNKTNFSIAMTPADVGTGILDWSRILPAAWDAGARQFYVEQEPPFAIPREESARRSFEFLFRFRAGS